MSHFVLNFRVKGHSQRSSVAIINLTCDFNAHINLYLKNYNERLIPNFVKILSVEKDNNA